MISAQQQINSNTKRGSGRAALKKRTRIMMTTSSFAVGYGTQSPSSITGKAIGGLCALIGVFILTLPVPIVVNSFASYYKNRLWRNEVKIELNF